MVKKKKFLIFGIVVLCLLLITGVSFAIWQMTFQQTTENVITTGCFKIEFSDINPINLDKAYPISDEEGRSLVPYEFTITNTCNSFASFQINLEILNTTTLENLDYLKVMLDDKTNLLTSNDEVTKTLANAKTSYRLKIGYLRENQRKTFSLRLWMGEDTPTSAEFMNKLFESKITVVATYKENLDNEIQANIVSQNESYSDQETFQIHVTSENYDLIFMSDDLETWEELEIKGKEITVEKNVTANGTYTYYFQDEAENIQDVTVVATKIDDKKPIANMSVTKSNNIIKIDASGSKDNETSIAKYYYSKDGTNYEESIENKFQFPNEYEYGLATTVLTNFERNQIKKVYLKVEDEVGNVSDVKEISIASHFAYDETIDNNLRYTGSDPNNYISFNDELWRIIGVMNNIDDGTGKKETRIKLIRNESIGEYSWDSSPTNINSGGGINEWSQADAMKLLNPGYSGVGASLYWNRQSGTCYNDSNNVTISCDFRSSGLKETSKSMIGKAIWHTGTNGTEVNYDNVKTAKFYELERSTNTGKICTSGSYCNDNVNRTTTWSGYVGLIYPSDYGYATSGDLVTSRKTCLNVNLYNWKDNYPCYSNSWLHNENFDQWTLSPNASSNYSWHIFRIDDDGSVYGGRSASRIGLISPVLYLNPNVKITSGLGTELQPFVLSLD